MTRFVLVRFGPCIAPLVLLLAAAGCSSRPDADPVTTSFVVMGCNRIEGKDWERLKMQDPSSANVPQLERTLADVRALDPAPSHLFFTGDLVLNLAPDRGETLRGQLEAWAGLWHRGPLAGEVDLVPMPGNHEMLMWDEQAKTEVPNPALHAVWLDWVGAHGWDRHGGNGPTPAAPNLDRLVHDESRVTYSFRVGDIHCVVANTDTLSDVSWSVTGHPPWGWVPVEWIASDLARAQADPAVRHILVFGHKPIRMPTFDEDGDSGIFDTQEHPLAERLMATLAAHDKVRAYVCAHSHLRELKQIGPGGVWQVIAGNAGSSLTKAWQPPGGPYFGFTEIRIHESGSVGVVNHHRPVPPAPQSYCAGAPVSPPRAAAGPELIIWPR